MFFLAAPVSSSVIQGLLAYLIARSNCAPTKDDAFIDPSVKNSWHANGRIVAGLPVRKEGPVSAARGATGRVTVRQGWLILSFRTRDGGLGRKIEALLDIFR